MRRVFYKYKLCDDVVIIIINYVFIYNTQKLYSKIIRSITSTSEEKILSKNKVTRYQDIINTKQYPIYYREYNSNLCNSNLYFHETYHKNIKGKYLKENRGKNSGKNRGKNSGKNHGKNSGKNSKNIIKKSYNFDRQQKYAFISDTYSYYMTDDYSFDDFMKDACFINYPCTCHCCPECTMITYKIRIDVLVP